MYLSNRKVVTTVGFNCGAVELPDLGSFTQRIPDSMESQVLKISAVDGRELGDTVMAQCQGEADINKLSPRKLIPSGVFPGGGHHRGIFNESPLFRKTSSVTPCRSCVCTAFGICHARSWEEISGGYTLVMYSTPRRMTSASDISRSRATRRASRYKQSGS